jgi:hypothetical protein
MKIVKMSQVKKTPFESPLFTGSDVTIQELLTDSEEYRVNIVNFGKGMRNTDPDNYRRKGDRGYGHGGKDCNPGGHGAHLTRRKALARCNSGVGIISYIRNAER